MDRFPRRVVLPFGWVITVRLVTDAEMLDALEEEDLVDGLWLVEEKAILIRCSLPVRRLRYILTHELIHAAVDLHHAALDTGKAKS